MSDSKWFADHPATTSFPGLLATTNRLLSSGLAPSTRAGQLSPVRQYYDFCTACSLPPLPATQQTLCHWAAFKSRTCIHATIMNYLSAVRSHHVDMSLADPGIGEQLARVCRGIRREQGDRVSVKRLPITTILLDRLRPLIDMAVPDQRMILAAMSTATAGLLRVGEISVVSLEPTRMLRVRDITFADGHFALLLRVSKMDPYGKGVTVHVSQPQTVTDMLAYWKRRDHVDQLLPNDPLFAHYNGAPLMRRTLLACTRSLLNRAGVDLSMNRGLSFRRGGATSLAAAGVADRVIKQLGRWKSWIFSIYIDTPLAPLIAAAATM